MSSDDLRRLACREDVEMNEEAAVGITGNARQFICLSTEQPTIVRDCCKGDDESLREREKFDLPPPKNPLSVWSKVQTRIWPS